MTNVKNERTAQTQPELEQAAGPEQRSHLRSKHFPWLQNHIDDLRSDLLEAFAAYKGGNLLPQALDALEDHLIDCIDDIEAFLRQSRKKPVDKP